MEKSIEKEFQDLSISDGKITPSKDKDSSSETRSIPSTPKVQSNLYLNLVQSNNLLMTEDNFIGISGLIGAGKTTLAKALGKVLNLPVYYEPIIENEYLEDFYRDMKRYSFSFQIYLLNCRFRQHQQVLWTGTGGIQDRTLYEDSIFAKVLYEDGNMEEREYKTYLNLFKSMSNFMKKNTLIIHLDCKPEESLERIKKRARGCETGITLEYLTKLYNGYEEFIKQISKVIPVLRVNYSKFKTAEEMAEIIKKEYESMQNVRKIDYDETL